MDFRWSTDMLQLLYPVLQWLDNKFLDRSMGQKLTVERLARCQIWTRYDFIYWGYKNYVVYTSQPQNLEEINDKITETRLANYWNSYLFDEDIVLLI